MTRPCDDRAHTMNVKVLTPRGIAWLGAAIVLLYTVWIGWPYLASTVTRDAAVTSWISVAAAPIGGYTTNPLYPGARVGADGRLATIVDPRADERDVARARAELARSDARVRAEELHVAEMQRELNLRAAQMQRFSSAFIDDATAAAAGSNSTLAALQLRLTLARDEQKRIEAMAREGLASAAAVDAARGATAGVTRDVAMAEASMKRGAGRRAAATGGVFLGEDGSDASSAAQTLSDARVRLASTMAGLEQLRSDSSAARDVLRAAEDAYGKTRTLDIKVPANAMVWSLISGPGAPVQPGSPVASWVDCRMMLVDAPLSDVEVALLHTGSRADVIIEGERTVRKGVVILARGAAGVLTDRDLAAVAKGRRPDLGAALVRLTPTADDVRQCRIGQAAYVNFPDVGALAVLRARLRL
jgi:multidrug resistance efflux pump